MKTGPIFLCIPPAMDAFCPCCFGKNTHKTEAVVSMKTLVKGRSDRWVGVCPRCRVRVIATIGPIDARAEWTERQMVEP